MTGSISIENSRDEASVTIPFGEKYAGSEQFKALFREGMALVETTATYLDGEGRQASKDLNSKASLAYATESMRLTTRLMQLASWLLIRRAVNDGEMTAEQACEEKNKVKLQSIGKTNQCNGFEELPEKLKHLIEESFRLYDRILKLDLLIHDSESSEKKAEHPLTSQLEMLRSAFEYDHTAPKTNE